MGVPLKAYYMLPVNGLQQDQTHEAEALPSYVSMDGFPTKNPNMPIRIQRFIFQFQEKLVSHKIYPEAFFGTWNQYMRKLVFCLIEALRRIENSELKHFAAS